VVFRLILPGGGPIPENLGGSLTAIEEHGRSGRQWLTGGADAFISVQGQTVAVGTGHLLLRINGEVIGDNPARIWWSLVWWQVMH